MIDEFNKALEIKSKELKECQIKQKIKSCISCPEINKCKIRDEYVIAVYESMNKKNAGGFEF